MTKLSVIFHRASSASLKRFCSDLNIVHRESGKSRFALFFDMTYCIFRYGIGYLDYVIFGFAFINREKRKTYVTMKDNIELVRKLNKREFYDVLNDKLLFNRQFESFIRREYLDLNEGPDKFETFLAGKEAFFAKRPRSFGGIGVKKIYTGDHPDHSKLYQSLMKDDMVLVEEVIEQHPEMSVLCPQSLNTLRICTIVNDQDKASVLYAILRIGNGKSAIDNVTSGGMYTMLDPEGTITHPAFCDKTALHYEVHPQNGTVFKGFRVPYFQEALKLCLEAAYVEPGLRYVGWDVGITPKGPVLVEGNNLPGYDMPQNHLFHEDGIGMKAVFDAAIQG